MSTSVQNFYLGLLADPHATPELQKKIFLYASRRKHLRLLATLAGHPNLDDEVDVLLGEFPDASVKAAWVRRPGRDKAILEELALRDTRASVLEGVAMVHDLSTAAYLKIVKRKQRKALWAVISNLTAPLEAKEAAASALGACYNTTTVGYREAELLKTMFGDMPELLPALIKEATHPTVLTLAVSSEEISSEKFDEIIKMIADMMLLWTKEVGTAALRYYDHRQRAYIDAAETLIKNAAVSLEQLEPLVNAAAAYDRCFAAGHSPTQNILGAVSNRKANGAVPLGSTRTALRVARVATNREDLLQYATTAAHTKDRYLASAVAINPMTDGEIMSVVALYLGYYAIERTLLARLRDHEVMVALLAAVPRYISDTWLLKAEHPEKLLTDITLKLAQNGSYLPPSVLHSRFMTPATAVHLPVSTLGNPELPTSTRQAASAALMHALGNRPERWEIFESVGEAFDGSLMELLNACGMLDVSFEEPEALPEDVEELLQEIPAEATTESQEVQAAIVPASTKKPKTKVVEPDPDQLTLL